MICRSVAIAVAVIAAAVGGSMHRVAAADYYAARPDVVQRAELGDPEAQAQLGRMYSIGLIVPQNYVLAAKWYQLAAEQGHGGAQFALGLLYNKGEGVPQDLVLSYFWLNLAAAQAVGQDRDFRVRIRNAVASKMTGDQIFLAQQMARSLYGLR